MAPTVRPPKSHQFHIQAPGLQWLNNLHQNHPVGGTPNPLQSSRLGNLQPHVEDEVSPNHTAMSAADPEIA